MYSMYYESCCSSDVTHDSMNLLNIIEVATLRNDCLFFGFWLALGLVKVDESHPLTSVSVTALSSSKPLDLYVFVYILTIIDKICPSLLELSKLPMYIVELCFREKLLCKLLLLVWVLFLP